LTRWRLPVVADCSTAPPRPQWAGGEAAGRKPDSLAERAEVNMASSGQTAADRWRRRAERASDAYGLVLILVTTTYVLGSVLSNRGWPAVITTVSTSATAIVALVSSHVRPSTVRRGLVLAALAILLAIISAISGARPWLAAASLLEVIVLGAGMVAVVQRVAVAVDVSFRTILGAISFYTSLGLLFTWIYSAIDRIEGGGEFFAGVATAKGNDFIFFSYTTLTTTGYGNLVPASHFGRMVAGLEMLTGQVFLVTLVAGLVSLWRPGGGLISRHERRAGGPTELSP
jgi:Ion channel